MTSKRYSCLGVFCTSRSCDVRSMLYSNVCHRAMTKFPYMFALDHLHRAFHSGKMKSELNEDVTINAWRIE